MKTLIKFCLMPLILLLGMHAYAAADSIQTVKTLQKHWAEANYLSQGKDQEEAFNKLLQDADLACQQFPESAEVLIWSGIIKSTYAGVKGGLGALKYAKSSKSDLEKALELDSQALQGSAYTTLGSLYFKVPGWPIGFGDDDKAEQFLLKALEINPDGIDPNYFYADYLREKHNYAEAEKYLKKALRAPPRTDRPVADRGRRAEINAALAEVEHHLK